MRILTVTPMPPDPHGSGAIPRVLGAQLTGLAAAHEVTVATLAGPNPEELDAADRLAREGFEIHAVRRHERAGLRRTIGDLRLAARWARGGRPRRALWFSEQRMQQLLDRLLAEGRFDVVAVEDSAMGGYRYARGPASVLTEHEVRRPRPVDWSGVRSRRPLRSALTEADWRRWKRFQPAVWARFRRIHVFSARDADAIAAAAPQLAPRVRVVPFGIVPPPAADCADVPGSVLFVGNFWHRPNVDAALWLGREILPALRRLVPGATLTIAGAAPPPELAALAADGVVVSGRVPDVQPLYEAASVVLAPVRIGGGMRMKVLEALAVGKPVVTTPKGVDGLDFDAAEPPIVLASTADELALRTAELLADDARRRSIGAQARRFALDHYSADAYALRLERSYRELLASAGSSDGR